MYQVVQQGNGQIHQRLVVLHSGVVWLEHDIGRQAD